MSEDKISISTIYRIISVNDHSIKAICRFSIAHMQISMQFFTDFFCKIKSYMKKQDAQNNKNNPEQ